MIWGIQGESSFEEVDRFELPNFILFRQWERRSASARRSAPILVIAAGVLLLLIVVVGVWVLGEQPNWALTILALGLVAVICATFYRRPLRFNSLILAKDFVVWETQCSQTWKRSFRFRHLDLPFRLKDSPLVVPVDEITNWSVQEEGQSDGTGSRMVRIVLWRGTVALQTFFVPSRDRAICLEKAIRAAVEHLNPGVASRQ